MGEIKAGRASDEYKKAFWNVMRTKNPKSEVFNSLSIGDDTEGGYLVPDEFERTLIQTLEEENILDRKSTRLNSSHVAISYAVFCLKKKKQNKLRHIVLEKITYI